MNIPNLSDRLNKDGGAGLRNKNPGNRTGQDSVFGAGVEKSSHTWTTYANWEDGYAGNTLLLLKYLDGTKKSKYGLGERNPCMISVIFTWAPPTENKSAEYVKFMCQYCGIEPDDRIAITQNNLVAIELVKGMKDSGCVQKNACIAGVKKCLDYYVKNGGRIDTTENLGKITSEEIKNLMNGVVVDINVGGGDSGDGGGDGGGSTAPVTAPPNAPRAIMASRGANTVYQLDSAAVKKNTLKLNDDRKQKLNGFLDTFIENAPELGRDIIKSGEMYDASILKSGQSSKYYRK